MDTESLRIALIALILDAQRIREMTNKQLPDQLEVLRQWDGPDKKKQCLPLKSYFSGLHNVWREKLIELGQVFVAKHNLIDGTKFIDILEHASTACNITSDCTTLSLSVLNEGPQVEYDSDDY